METQGTELGRYRIVGEVGRGTFGTVYRALDTLIGREVAIKSFHPAGGQRSEEALRDELLHEARNAGMLSHPNVVTVYDVVEGNDGSWFMAMEYVEGRSLARILVEDGPPDFERTVDWVSQIAAALDYLHAMGLVHRDLKPANVLVTERGRVKLTDFGIASSARGPTRGPTRVPTGAGEPRGDEAILGTPGYMAPEQILGREITARADVWSLGVVLYELLTGRRPFGGRSVADVVHRVIHAPVPFPEVPGASGDPDHPGAGEGRAGLPDGVRELLERALAKEPSRRFPSAGALARSLRRVLYRAAGEVGEGAASAGMLDHTLVSGFPLGPAGISSPRGASPESRSPRPVWRRLPPVALAGLLVALVAVSALFAHHVLAPGPELAGRGEGGAVPGDGSAPAPNAGGTGDGAGHPDRSAGRETRVRIELWSDAPEGVLSVYGGGEELLRRGFSYYDRGWIFGRTPSSGGFEEEIAVPTGLEALQVYVTRSGSPARRLEVPGGFEAGSRRVLRIHLPAEGEVTAAWAPR